MDDVGRAALQGGALGAGAGATYGLVLAAVIAAQDAGDVPVASVLGGACVVALIAGGIAAFVGFTAGVLLGALCLPLVRRVPVAAALTLVVAVVGGLCLLAFPDAVLGGRQGGRDLDEVLTLTVLPAALAAAAAARHVVLLARWA